MAIPQTLQLEGQHKRYFADPTGQGDCLSNGFALIFAEQVRNGNLKDYANTPQYDELLRRFADFHTNFNLVDDQKQNWEQFKAWLTYYESPNDVEQLLAPIFRKWMADLNNGNSGLESEELLKPLYIDSIDKLAEKLQFQVKYAQGLKASNTPVPVNWSIKGKTDQPNSPKAIIIQALNSPGSREGHFIVYLDDQDYAKRATNKDNVTRKRFDSDQDKIKFLHNGRYEDYYFGRNKQQIVSSPPQQQLADEEQQEPQEQVDQGDQTQIPHQPETQPPEQNEVPTGVQHSEQLHQRWHAQRIKDWWVRENNFQDSFVLTQQGGQPTGFAAKFNHGQNEITLQASNNEIQFKNASRDIEIIVAAEKTINMLFINKGWIDDHGNVLPQVPRGQTLAIEPTGNDHQKQIIARVAQRFGVEVVGMGGPTAEQQQSQQQPQQGQPAPQQGQQPPQESSEQEQEETETQSGVHTRPRRLGHH